MGDHAGGGRCWRGCGGWAVAEPRRLPVSVVAIRDGSGERELLTVDDAETPQEAARWLAAIAERLRERGVVAVLELTEAATERVVARRRVWP